MASATFDDAEEVDVPSNRSDDVAPASVSSLQHSPAGRYGAKRFSPLAIAITIGLHVALIGALLHISHVADEKPRLRLAVVDLRSPPPPSKQPEPKKPTPKQVAVVEQVAKAPPPLIQLSSAMTAPPPLIEDAPKFQAAAAPAAPPAPPAPPVPPVIQGGNLGTQMLSGKPPTYPIDCRRKREQGTVVLALTLGTDGRVAAIAISRSSGTPRLDDAARDAVRKWRWAPVMRDGVAVMVRGLVEIPFVLQG